MTANLQKQIGTLETRADSLENILGQFIASMNDMMIRREADTKAFKEEIRADTEAFKISVNKTMSRMEADTEAFKTSVNKSMNRMDERAARIEASVSRMEADTEAFKTSVNKSMNRMDERAARIEASVSRTEADTEAFKASVNKSLARTEADTEKHRKEMNKKWGDLSNKMGTIVEDMVDPSIPQIIRNFFRDDEPDLFAVRVMKRNSADPGRRREFDVIAMTERNFYVNETKSNLRSEYIGKFIEMLGEIRDYFPEIGDRRIIPIFSSLHIPEDTMTYLTRSRIYAMGMGEDTMTLLNFGELAE